MVAATMVDSIPRFCRSCESHFLVVLSSLRMTKKVLSLSCSGMQALNASLALQQKKKGRQGKKGGTRKKRGQEKKRGKKK